MPFILVGLFWCFGVALGYEVPVCVDDPRGWLRGAGLTCEGVSRQWQCGLRLVELNVTAPDSLTAAEVCPMSCQDGCKPISDWFARAMPCFDMPECDFLLDDAECGDMVPPTPLLVPPLPNATHISISSLCKLSCGNCPVAPQTPPPENCEDDPGDVLRHNATTCTELRDAVGCAATPSFLDKRLYEVCPSTCGTCMMTPKPDKRVQCADMPGCEQFTTAYGCDATALRPNTKDPVRLVAEMCPKTCNHCHAVLGDQKKCSALYTDSRYHFLSGLSDMSYYELFSLSDDTKDNIIKGGYIGNPGGCEYMNSDVDAVPLGGRFCTMGIYGATVRLCVPYDCRFNDLSDSIRSFHGGWFQGILYGDCQDDFAHIDGGDNDYTDTPFTWPAILMLVVWAVLVLLAGLATFVPFFKKVPIVSQWDMQKNYAELVKVRVARTSFLDFFRVAAMGCILVAHTYIYTYVNGNVANYHSGVELLKRFYNFSIYGFGGSAVDTFFFLSGFLGAWVTCKIVYKDRNVVYFKDWKSIMKFIILGYVQRYLRIAPLMMFVLLSGLHLQPLFDAGPYWTNNYRTTISEPCQDKWWQQALLISDSYDWPNDSCYGWMWYLSTDFHMSLILPFLVLPFATAKHSKKRILSSMRIAFVVLPTLALLLAQFVLSKTEHITRMDDTYVRPYLRAAPYLYGVLGAVALEVIVEKRKPEGERFFEFFKSFCWKLSRTDPAQGEEVDVEEEVQLELTASLKDDVSAHSFALPPHATSDVPAEAVNATPIHIFSSPPNTIDYATLVRDNVTTTSFLSTRKSAILRKVVYLASTALLVSIGIVLDQRSIAQEERDAWSRDAHDYTTLYYAFGWGFALMLLSVTYSLGYGGVVLRVMTSQIMAPLGKLTYGVYLVHPILMTSFRYMGNGSMRVNNFIFVWDVVPGAVLSYAVSFVLWMLVECPLSSVLSFSRRNPKAETDRLVAELKTPKKKDGPGFETSSSGLNPLTLNCADSAGKPASSATNTDEPAV